MPHVQGVELPVGALGVRLFVGYRAAAFVPQAGDDGTTRAKKRAEFFNELGSAFMPATAVMQAPLGLAAYLPAVLDTDPASGLPDEVAAIVYASRTVYDRYRETSLSRRIYTRSHVAVFDMARSVAQFGKPLDDPNVVQANGSAHRFSFLFEQARVDWQAGQTRVVFITPGEAGEAFQWELLHRLGACAVAATEFGVDQILVVCANSFAALWIHAPLPVRDPVGTLDLLPGGATIVRDLEAIQVPVTGDFSPTPTVDGPVAITFRFERRLDLFIPPQ
ncbi:hypothetical protein [Massilia psychrophila]|uniref:Uncharacterized protein n=1 Tax=Massilia psychrophila TaxID=1603353 RepID=A0A2G8SZP3_9BURK|nr:hypothetical protein [Massilia psychrophila]PIL39183.1 hypothetical protein CR103_13925 [Massilia psychrophila]GGE82293.1 hypothetical protein GCM10008020_29000 [Massilia psychrophila]